LSPLLGFDRAFLFLADKENACLKIAQLTGEPEGSASSFSEYQVSVEEQGHLVARVANLGKPVWPEEVKDSSFVFSDPLLRVLNPQSFMAVPLISRGKVIGVLVVDRKDHAHPISAADQDLLLTFSNQIAIAIENAQLYEDLKSSYIRSVQSLAHASGQDPYAESFREGDQHALQVRKR
jgi:GAF domain-containing protein